jgi:hypothetical protein
MLMAPDLQGLKLFCSRNIEFLSVFFLARFLIDFKKTLGND